jgi:hypothetical protein
MIEFSRQPPMSCLQFIRLELSTFLSQALAYSSSRSICAFTTLISGYRGSLMQFYDQTWPLKHMNFTSLNFSFVKQNFMKSILFPCYYSSHNIA